MVLFPVVFKNNKATQKLKCLNDLFNEIQKLHTKDIIKPKPFKDK